MKSNITGIILNLNHPRCDAVWVVKSNCDEIRLEFHSGKVCYLPIENGISGKCFNAESVEMVTYTDGSVVEYKQKTA